MASFSEKLTLLFDQYESLIIQPNEPEEGGNGVFTRYRNPILTAALAPVFWRYDLDESSNPWLMERQGINAT